MKPTTPINEDFNVGFEMICFICINYKWLLSVDQAFCESYTWLKFSLGNHRRELGHGIVPRVQYCFWVLHYF